MRVVGEEVLKTVHSGGRNEKLSVLFHFFQQIDLNLKKHKSGRVREVSLSLFRKAV